MRRREFPGILGGAAEVQVRITLLAQTLQELDGRSVVICVACRLRWNHNSRWGSMSLLVPGMLCFDLLVVLGFEVRLVGSNERTNVVCHVQQSEPLLFV